MDGRAHLQYILAHMANRTRFRVGRALFGLLGLLLAAALAVWGNIISGNIHSTPRQMSAYVEYHDNILPKDSALKSQDGTEVPFLSTVTITIINDTDKTFDSLPVTISFEDAWKDNPPILHHSEMSHISGAILGVPNDSWIRNGQFTYIAPTFTRGEVALTGTFVFRSKAAPHITAVIFKNSELTSRVLPVQLGVARSSTRSMWVVAISGASIFLFGYLVAWLSRFRAAQ
jgi:hypothetical protein